MSQGTPFVQWQGPTRLEGYRRGLEHSAQPATIPRTFVDAMEVREQVFVEEQKVPIEYEFDSDDPRSCHWVAYASVNTIIEEEVIDEQTGQVTQPRRSETRSVPIGTVRMVPFPHALHPQRGGVYIDNKLVGFDRELAGASADVAPPAVDQGNIDGEAHGTTTEPYLKLGRLAVVKEFRGLGVASLLIRAALSWIQQNPEFFDPSIKAAGLESLGVDDPKQVPRWNGLLCVHAQKAVAPTWARWGFVVDEQMGEWKEEEILHVGMFLRLEIQRKQPIAS